MSLLTNIFRIVPPTLKSGWCPKTWQDLANVIIGGTQITSLIQVGTWLYNYGSATPLPENRIFPWLNTDDGLWWTFKNGLWTSPRPKCEQDPNLRILWMAPNGTPESDVWSKDGGNGQDPSVNPPTIYTGALWEVDHDMDGRVFIGAGNVPGTANPVISPDLSDTGGEGEHSLTEAEMPPHTHDFQVIAQNSAASGSGALTGGDNNNPNDGEFNGITESTGGSGSPAAVEAHNNLQPYKAGWHLMPTVRIYYTRPA